MRGVLPLACAFFAGLFLGVAHGQRGLKTATEAYRLEAAALTPLIGPDYYFRMQIFDAYRRCSNTLANLQSSEWLR